MSTCRIILHALHCDKFFYKQLPSAFLQVCKVDCKLLEAHAWGSAKHAYLLRVGSTDSDGLKWHDGGHHISKCLPRRTSFIPPVVWAQRPTHPALLVWLPFSWHSETQFNVSINTLESAHNHRGRPLTDALHQSPQHVSSMYCVTVSDAMIAEEDNLEES